MNFIADLHIHSPYSRATSKHSTLTGLAGWASAKGIHVIGTGDFTHPEWFAELREQLVPAEQGLFLSCPDQTGQPEHRRLFATPDLMGVAERRNLK